MTQKGKVLEKLNYYKNKSFKERLKRVDSLLREEDKL